MGKDNSAQKDHVDLIIAQWQAERPDLDARPMALVGRTLRAAKVFDREIMRVIGSFDLSFGEFDVLACLLRSGAPYELTPGELLETLMLSSGAMTNRIDRLERSGLVARRPDPDDRRGVRVALTDKGKELIGKAITAHVENEARVLDTLSTKEQETLSSLLRKVLTQFGQ